MPAFWPKAAALPRTVTRQEIVPPLQKGLLAFPLHPAHGTLFPQPWIRTAAGRRLLDSTAGTGWRLVLDQRNPPDLTADVRADLTAAWYAAYPRPFCRRGRQPGTKASLKKMAFSQPGSTAMAAGPRSSGPTTTSSVSPTTRAHSAICYANLRHVFNDLHRAQTLITVTRFPKRGHHNEIGQFQDRQHSTWGVIEGDEAIDVGAVLRDRYPDLKSVIAADALSAVRDATRNAKRTPRLTSPGCRSFPIRTRFSASA